jgi:hypothetical protein
VKAISDEKGSRAYTPNIAGKRQSATQGADPGDDAHRALHNKSDTLRR